MTLDELSKMQAHADFLRKCGSALADAFNQEIPTIRSAIIAKVPLNLTFSDISRPEILNQHDVLVIYRTLCLRVRVPDTPVGADVRSIKSYYRWDPANKDWTVGLSDDSSDPELNARTRQDNLSLLLRIGPSSGKSTSPRYLWWRSASDDDKIIDAVIDTLSGRNGPSEFTFETGTKKSQGCSLLAVAIVACLFLLRMLSML